jgi:hypothetical protein
MIAFDKVETSDWQSAFKILLPEIERSLRSEFRFLHPEAREEAIQEGIVLSLLAYVRLHENVYQGDFVIAVTRISFRSNS